MFLQKYEDVLKLLRVIIAIPYDDTSKRMSKILGKVLFHFPPGFHGLLLQSGSRFMVCEYLLIHKMCLWGRRINA